MTIYYPTKDCYEPFCKYIYKYEQIRTNLRRDQDLDGLSPCFRNVWNSFELNVNTRTIIKRPQQTMNQALREWSHYLNGIRNEEQIDGEKLFYSKDGTETTNMLSFLYHLRNGIAHAGIQDGGDYFIFEIYESPQKRYLKAYGKIGKEKIFKLINAFLDDSKSEPVN